MSTRETYSKPGSPGGNRPPSVACPDGDALMSYLYDEFEPAGGLDRQDIAHHLRECQVCASELEALGGVREQLSAWVAPDMDLGFRLIQEPVHAGRWRNAFDFLWAGWLRPAIPLAAAALVLGAALGFARLDVRYTSTGLQVRTGWGHRPADAPADATVTAASPATESARAAEMRAEIASLRQELRRAQALMASSNSLSAASVPGGAQSAPVPVPVSTSAGAAGRASDAALLKGLRQLIDESEVRQQQNLQLRISEIARDFALRRQADLVQVEQGFSRLAGQRQQDAVQQQRLIDSLKNVSVQGRPPQ